MFKAIYGAAIVGANEVVSVDDSTTKAVQATSMATHDAITGTEQVDMSVISGTTINDGTDMEVPAGEEHRDLSHHKSHHKRNKGCQGYECGYRPVVEKEVVYVSRDAYDPCGSGQCGYGPVETAGPSGFMATKVFADPCRARGDCHVVSQATGTNNNFISGQTLDPHSHFISGQTLDPCVAAGTCEYISGQTRDIDVHSSGHIYGDTKDEKFISGQTLDPHRHILSGQTLDPCVEAGNCEFVLDQIRDQKENADKYTYGDTKDEKFISGQTMDPHSHFISGQTLDPCVAAGTCEYVSTD